jgi:hypothetical protein
MVCKNKSKYLKKIKVPLTMGIFNQLKTDEKVNF